MKIGIVSDTHDNGDVVERAVKYFEREDVDAVVHCGDFVAPFSATPFENDQWEFHAVRGNNDGEWALQSTVAEFGTYHGEAAELTLDGADAAVYHGTSGVVVDTLVDCGTYDYVFHGHTHERGHEDGDTVRINPGGIAIPPAPDPAHVAVLDTETGNVAFERIEGD
ncbi:YfcE family phosphodiesterase [Halobacteriales archaeon QS_9_68_17]|nr:MAG: YfcE family phosphodiesterase [Halobacteriales archaeon QS_9_68_17]